MKKTVSANIMSLVNLKKPEKILTESEDNTDRIEVFMNTWANYNEYGADEGITPTGWMTLDKALEYCKKYAEYEPFINDYENSPIELSEYDNAPQRIEQLMKIDEREDRTIIKNAIESGFSDDIDEIIEKIDSGDYIWFPGCEDDYDLGKNYVDMVGWEGISDIQKYFKEDEFRDEIYNDEKDYYASEHGVDPESEDFPEDEFEDWLDEVVEERARSFDGKDDYYFDYEQLGEDLEYDGYTFTTDGCICIY